MKIPVPLLAVVAFTAVSIVQYSATYAASFDCSKASNKAEILICGVPELSALDVRLAEHYRKARETQSNKSILRDAQRAWLKQRDQCENLECLRSAYLKRIHELTLMPSSNKGAALIDSPVKTENAVVLRHPASLHVEGQKLTREQEVEFRTKSAAYFLDNTLKAEKAIAALPNKELAVLVAAGKINRLIADKKESGKFNQQQLMLISSIVVGRLGLLSQTANMPPAVIACHFSESRALENVSKGLPLKAPACRNDAYGADIQMQIIMETGKPSWALSDKLVTEWVVNAFMYAEDIGIVIQYRRDTSPSQGYSQQ
ncbi:DUF1311 domain-containing protein [Alcaligenaceae bacterium]|nr:DUF1311 domain-containing protein [Alcaligenaceae bacterium]